MFVRWVREHSFFGSVLLRVGIALVYLYFGVSQLYRPETFIGWLPPEASILPLAPVTLIVLNGVFEVTLSLLLVLGVYTRFSALLLGLHLLAITFSIGYTEIGVRDFGLSMATLSLVFLGPDRWCLDKRLSSSEESVRS